MKLAIIGIDGFDPLLFERYRSELPVLDRLAREGWFTPLESVFPPDSVPAWCSIYTGLPPTEHGVLQSFDYLSRKNREFSPDLGGFRGRTFWDLVGQAGRRVCVLNAFMAHPAWKVNGVMVSGPVFEGGGLSAYPEAFAESRCWPPLGGIVDFPRKKELPEFVRKTRDLTDRQARCFLDVARNTEWDLFFVTFLTFDRLAHFTWRYTDPSDPTYPGKNEIENTLLEAVRQYDRIVGEFLEALPANTGLFVISDHGHGMRCTHVFNINEYLRGRGYLQSSVKGQKYLAKKYWIEVLKVKVLEFLDRFELQDVAFRIAKLLPNRKALKKSTHVTETGKSLVLSPDFDGTNPFGGVSISREICEARGLDYETFRNELMEELLNLEEPGSGGRILLWAAPREALYGEGPRLGEYPDIVFELQPHLGVQWNLFGKRIGRNTTHRKISGGHRREGVLFAHGVPGLRTEKKPGVLDLAPTILDILGVDPPEEMRRPLK